MFRRMKNALLAVMVMFVVAVAGAFGGDAPATFSMKLGAFEVIAIQDAPFEMNANLFKNGDPEVIKKYMPEGKLPCSINTYVVKTGKKIILIDAGNGDGIFGKGHTAEVLQSIGIAPGDVDIVLLTHAHGDHVGGLVKDGKPAFPKARLMLAKDELASVDDAAIAKLPADYKPYFMPANTAVHLYGKQVKVFQPDTTVVKGITAVSLPGHSAGSTGFLIESEGRKFLMFGDLLHIAEVQFPHPEYSLMYDADIEKAAATRKATLARSVSEKLIIAGSHIPFPGIGTVAQENGEFVFTPVK